MPLVAWSAPSVRWSNTFAALCRRHHRPASRRCSARFVRCLQRPINTTQILNAIAGAWPGARWALPRSTRCTKTFRQLGLCISGENGRRFRRESYTQNGRRRTAKTVETVQRFRPMAYSRFGSPNSQNGQSVQTRGLSAGVSWKPRRHVASSLEIPSFNEGGLRAAEEIIHAPHHRGPAAECAGAQL
jgi:hypothetical protein